MDAPIIWRGIERLIVVLGSIFIAYLGYKLYVQGINKGKIESTVKSPIIKFAISGTGPGLFFMVFGATVLMLCLYTGKAERTVTEKQIIDTIKEVVERTVKEELRGENKSAIPQAIEHYLSGGDDTPEKK